MHVRREVVRHGRVAGHVPVAEFRAVALRRERIQLVRRGRAAGKQCGDVVGRRVKIVARIVDTDDGVVKTAFLVVIYPQTRLNVQAVDDFPIELSEQSEAGVAEADLIRAGQAVQYERIAGGRRRRRATAGAHRDVAGVQQPAAGRRALHL